MVVSITGNDGLTFLFQDGDVERVRSTITANPQQIGMAGLGPASAFLYDFEGVVKVINVSGALTEASSTRTFTSGGSPTGSVTSILDQKQWLEKQLSGSQLIKEFVSPYEEFSFDGSSFVNTKCLFSMIEFDNDVDEPARLPFSFVLVVGVG